MDIYGEAFLDGLASGLSKVAQGETPPPFLKKKEDEEEDEKGEEKKEKKEEKKEKKEEGMEKESSFLESFRARLGVGQEKTAASASSAFDKFKATLGFDKIASEEGKGQEPEKEEVDAFSFFKSKLS